MKLVAFCEAPADFRLASGLVDRVLRESAPAWVIDNFELPDAIRRWHPDGSGRPYFHIHELNQYASELRVRTVRGHFNGRPGGTGSAMARKAFLIARASNKTMISVEPRSIGFFTHGPHSKDCVAARYSQPRSNVAVTWPIQ